MIQWASLQAAALAGLSLISGPPVILGEKAGDISQASNQALRIESVFCSKNIHRPSFFSSAGISSTENASLFQQLSIKVLRNRVGIYVAF